MYSRCFVSSDRRWDGRLSSCPVSCKNLIMKCHPAAGELDHIMNQPTIAGFRVDDLLSMVISTTLSDTVVKRVMILVLGLMNILSRKSAAYVRARVFHHTALTTEHVAQFW